jgi:hypothetical protein
LGLLPLLLLLIVPAGVQAQSYTNNYGIWAYTTTNGTITVTGYTGAGGSVTIPDRIPDTTNGLPVTSIGADAFLNYTNLTSVTIGDGITAILPGAFEGCSLANITIPSSVTSIGDDAFAGCNMTNLVIPNSVTNLGLGVFNGCESLTNITIGSGLTIIGGFEGCHSLASVTIGTNVASIGDWAFEDCQSLRSITIPSSVTNIGAWAFYDPALISVYFEGNAPNVGPYAFAVGNIYYLPGTTGWDSTFGGRPAFLWDPVAQVGYTTASGAISITAYAATGGPVTIPDRIPDTTNGLPVTSIATTAFYQSGLTTATIPSSVTNIGEEAFSACPSLTNITVDPLNSNFSSVDGVLFDKSLTTLIQYPGGKAGSYMIPGSVIHIGDGAFSGCSSLTSVTIPNSVTSIGSYAFTGCTNLTSVTIPDSVAAIGDSTFQGCSGLSSVAIGNSVSNIGTNAFNGCSSLTAITVGTGNSVYSDLDGVLFNQSLTTLIVYPEGIAGNYTIPNSVTSIKSEAFENCTNLTGVTIGTNVASIGDWAFEDCQSLRSITIPSSVTNIGDHAFWFCANLTSVYFQGNAPTSDWTAFWGDSAIVYYLAGTTGWGSTFAGLAASLWDPAAQTAYTAANGAAVITKYTGPGGAYTIPGMIASLPVTTIGDSAFLKSGLTSIVIPSSVTTIGGSAFEFCSSLTSVYFRGNAPTCETAAFWGDNAPVYYLPGTTGWGTTFGSLLTVLWRPEVQTSGGSFGVQTNQFGFNVNWASGMTIVVEACTNLANPTWSRIQTNTLTGNPLYFTDPQWSNYPSRFYRVTWP